MTTSSLNGLPDVGTLERMANAALAEYERATGLPPASPPLGRIPADAPAPVPADAAFPSRSGAGTPSHAAPPDPLRASPTGPAPSGIVPEIVTPESLGLPGEAALRALLGPELSLAPQAPREATGAAMPDFYFLEGAGAGPAAAPGSPGRPAPGSVAPPFDLVAVRSDFPILRETVEGKPLVWLDNAATTQKPRQVIDRLRLFYERENSNVHRGAHMLAARSTDAYEEARGKVRRFLGARLAEEIVWVRGATEGINLVSQSWGRANIGSGDEIVVSQLEHHANIVPWQMLAAEKGATLKVIPVSDEGELLVEELGKLLGPRTKLVAITQVSNALGTVTPVRTVADMAHAVGAKVLVDGAQAVSHMPVDVVALDADWYVFSGHKVFGPTGIGAVYGRKELLESAPPWQGGGNMIQDVTFERTVYHGAPARLEAGTGNIADAVGLGAAIDYVTRLGMANVAAWEHLLLDYGTRLLEGIPGLRLVGTAPEKAGVLSFVLEGYRTEEVGGLLNKDGIAVRSGHHCAQPILRRLGLEATVRPSLAFYNTCEELDTLAASVWKLVERRRGRSIAVPGLRGV